MSAIAIKHMTAAQACTEADRLQQLYSVERSAVNKLSDEADHYDRIGMHWMRRMAKVMARMTAIGKGAEHATGEVAALLSLNEVYFERYSSRLAQRNALYASKTVHYAKMDKIHRRQGLITKRRWELHGPVDRTKIVSLKWVTEDPDAA
jgi:hypothetical protein